MSENVREKYAAALSAMIRKETVSEVGNEDRTKFREFHALLKELFPHIFAAAKFEDMDGSFLMRWKGKDSSALPVLFMNHHDTVEANGDWNCDPFGGEIRDGKLWGRGTLDTKGGLWAMLQAADELAGEGFVPETDIYFESACNEETDGALFNDIRLTTASVESEIVNEQLLNEVKTLMENLPEEQRRVVFMRIYQELSFKEIADETGVSLNTALGRMHYALINMRRMANERNIFAD